MQRRLPLSKVWRPTSCTIHTQPFTSRWCSSWETNSRAQRITLLPPKTANFIRKRKNCSKKRKRSSSWRPQFRHLESRRRPPRHRHCSVCCTPPIILLSPLPLSNPRCLSHSFEHALPNVHPEIPSPVRPPNIAAAKAACRGIIVLVRQSSLHAGAV